MDESNFDRTRLNEKDFDWIQIKKIATELRDAED